MAGRAVTPLSGPAVWTGESFAQDRSWLHHFDAAQITEMARALAVWGDCDLRGITAPAELMPSLKPLVARTKVELAGRGFVLLRGLPVGDFGEAACRRLFWAIGMLYGRGLTQNAQGELICPIFDAGIDFGYDGRHAANNTRGYLSNADLNFHCDPTDVVGLLCLRKAMAGGESAIVSAAAIYNEILRSRPGDIARLEQGFSYDRKGQQSPGEAPATPPIPVFVRRGERVSCRYGRSYIHGGGAKLGQPLTEADIDLLDFFDATARRDDLAMQMAFEPGDIQLLNNFAVLHGRRAFTDDADPGRRRLLLRLWLELDDSPWADEDEVMRHAYARFGKLGRDIDGRI